MPAVPMTVKQLLSTLLAERDKRAATAKKNNLYYEGNCPFPTAVVQARMTKAYRLLMPMAEAPWGSLVVDSVQDRLEVAGIRSKDPEVAKELWKVWQVNAMDAESKLGHNGALIDGRTFATIWPADDDGYPEITLDNSEQMIVQYREGSRRHRVAALRHWVDEKDQEFATLYTADGIYKFEKARDQTRGAGRVKANDGWWDIRQPADEEWPVNNPYGVVPVVEISVNRRLKAGAFPYARGEFQHCIGLIDRINLLTFLGLVVALWMGFPLRGVIGEQITRRILTDDAGDALIDATTGEERSVAEPPFEVKPDSLFQLEDPAAKIVEYKAADRDNLGVSNELDQLAVITKTPRHYFPLNHQANTVSADAIRASEGGLHAKVTGHKASLGEGWEEVLRVAGKMLDTPVELERGAELLWKDHESRSLAERADAATKLAAIDLPWQWIAEKVLNCTQEEIGRLEGQMAASGLLKLIAEARTPTPAAELPAPAGQ